MAPTTREESLALLKALADETRFHILMLISDADEPVSAQQVADSLSLHPNTVRPHLERLREVGFLELVQRSDGRVGRPQHLYVVAPDAPTFGVEPKSQRVAAAVMAETLASLIDRIELSPDDAAEVGRAWGREVEVRSSERDKEGSVLMKPADPTSTLVNDFSRLGFEPTGTVEEVFFGECPFRQIADLHPEIVCAAHRGICEGILDVEGHGATVETFSSRPESGRCSVRIAT